MSDQNGEPHPSSEAAAASQASKDAATATATTTTTKANSTTLKSPSPVKAADAVPASSPPIAEAQPDIAAHGTTQNGADDASADLAADGENDSEAETLISSPVKKREALKRVEGLESGARSGRTGGQNGPEDTPNLGLLGHGAIGKEGQSRVKGGEDEKDDKDKAVKEEAKSPAHDDESDNLSEVSSVPLSQPASSPAASQSDDEGESGSGREQNDQDEDGDSDDAEAEDDGEEHEVVVNPRKRKHRESYLHASMEPPRRRRRASDAENGNRNGNGTSNREDREAAFSPQPRRHRRTASTQSSWTDTHRSSGSTSNVANPATSRQRRSATHFPVRETKAAKHVWDSDTSSETSHQLHRNRLTRNANRSTSTPGRPMGRDHKRHLNKYGFTRLAEACESGDLDAVKEWREKDPEQLEQKEFAGNTPLQVASLNGYPEIVSYLLSQNCDQHCFNTDKDTPLIDAVENGHIEVVQLLLKAGVDPRRQNLKGQQALDLVTDETDNAKEIRAALREAIEDWTKNGRVERYDHDEAQIHRPGPSKGLHFMARTYENMIKLVSENDRTGIQEFLDARVPVDNTLVAVAARTGDTFTVSMLLADMTPKKARQRAEKPMLAVIGSSHFEMVKFLCVVETFEPRWRDNKHKSDTYGMTWYEIAEHRKGPYWREEKEMFKRLYDEKDQPRAPKGSKSPSSSPISRRDHGKRRRRSPTKKHGSDVDMDDVDTPEQARIRRRLVSKKDMQGVSRRRSLSSSSDVPTKRPGGTFRDDDQEDAAPGSAARKSNRRRKANSTPHSQERSPKRGRSSSVREDAPALDSSRLSRSIPGSSDDNSKADVRVKYEPVDRQRADANEEALRKAEHEASIHAAKLAEDRRLAEQARKEEEGRRLEAERKAEEIKRLAEERRDEEERQLQTLPSALRHVLAFPSHEGPDRKRHYIQRHFLPVQAVRGADLEAELDPHELWMLTFQAAGILTGQNALDLLQITAAEPSPQTSSLSTITTLPSTHAHRQAMLTCLQSTSLVHEMPTDCNSDFGDAEDLAAELAAAEAGQQRIQEDSSKFLSMPSLCWMRYADFRDAVAAASDPHLRDLWLDARTDCCLDPSAFDVAEPPPPPRHPAKELRGLADGTVASPARNGDATSPAASASAAVEEGQAAPTSAKSAATTRAAATGKAAAVNGIHDVRAGPGITTFTVIQE